MNFFTLRGFARYTLLVLGLSAGRLAASELVSTPAAAVGKLKELARKAEPDIAPASGEPQEATKLAKLPPGLTVSVWAAEPMLANPVAFTFDERGRIFVAETYRYRSSTLDIRDYMWALEDDIANRTVEDRLSALRRQFGAEGVAQLSIESERVRLLEDTTGRGVADRSRIFAEGFNGPLDGVAAGVLARRGRVWFTDIPSVWLLDGESKDGVATQRKELSRGYGVHFSLTGHDLHGLIFGPDGKIYFSVGDRGAHATSFDGRVADVPDSGAVFRCNPDGTEFELYATGQRNPQSLAFNEVGDLFTADNDADIGDSERLLHIVEGVDHGWRIGYQYGAIGRGSSWMAERAWQPRFPEQPAYLLAPVGTIGSGPSGIAYYPGTGLNDSYRGTLFVTQFVGTLTKSGIVGYRFEPKGATYRLTQETPFLSNALPTDTKFGPDGRLYYTDWADGWNKSKRGRIFAISDPAHANDDLIKSTERLIKSDFTTKPLPELVTLLGHADWRVRLEAQYTLAERNAVDELAKVAKQRTAPALARLHAIWGLGQVAARKTSPLKPVRSLLSDADAEVRAQALHVLGDRRVEASEAYVKALRDPSNRVKFFGAQALARLHRPETIPAVVEALRANHDEDDMLRLGLVRALVGANDLPALLKAANDPSRSVRLAVLLAFRRLQRPEIARFLTDPDPLLVQEAAGAINDAPIPGAFPALAALLQRPVAPVTGTEAEPPAGAGFTAREIMLVRAINAAFRLGTPEQAEAVARYAERADVPPSVRAEALTQLGFWPAPPSRDRVVGIFRPVIGSGRDAAAAVAILVKQLPELLAANAPDVVQIAAMKAVQQLQLNEAIPTLEAIVADEARTSAVRMAALDRLDALHDPQLAAVVRRAGDSNSPALRQAALPLAARLSPAEVAPLVAKLVRRGTPTEQKAAFTALRSLQDPLADVLLAEQLRRLALGRIAPEAELELVEAAEARDDPTVKQLLSAWKAEQAGSGDPMAPFAVSLRGGDADRGKTLFQEHPVLACVRCHRVGADGADVGPNLSSIGARASRDYILESIVRPNAKLADGYAAVTLTLKNGSSQSGILAGEDARDVTLKQPDGQTVAVPVADIAKRETAPSSMPEIFGSILTRAELRDLVEYLASLNGKTGSAQPSQ
jgi:quinoprotein glucose dehydrogenase